jgi:hypothetical protein
MILGAVLKVATSALGAIVVETVTLLLPVLGSKVGEVLLAVLVIMPAGGAIRPIVRVTTLLLAKVGSGGKLTIPVAGL